MGLCCSRDEKSKIQVTSKSVSSSRYSFLKKRCRREDEVGVGQPVKTSPPLRNSEESIRLFSFTSTMGPNVALQPLMLYNPSPTSPCFENKGGFVVTVGKDSFDERNQRLGDIPSNMVKIDDSSERCAQKLKLDDPVTIVPVDPTVQNENTAKLQRCKKQVIFTDTEPSSNFTMKSTWSMGKMPSFSEDDDSSLDSSPFFDKSSSTREDLTICDETQLLNLVKRR